MCIIFIAWLGKMARNSHSIARYFNAAMESIGVQLGLSLDRYGYSIYNCASWCRVTMFTVLFLYYDL